MRCFYNFWWRIPSRWLSGEPVAFPNAFGTLQPTSFPTRNSIYFLLFLPFKILFPVHCFAPGEIPFCILYLPILCSFSVFGPAAIMAVHPVIQILTVAHVISVQRFTINDVDKIFHKKKHLTNEVLLRFCGEYRIRTGGLLPASKRITILI